MFKSKSSATKKSFTQESDLKDLINGKVQEVFYKESESGFFVRGFHTSSFINPDATINQAEKERILREFSSSNHMAEIKQFISSHEVAAARHRI